jgi:hypothetical protein
MQAHYSNRKIDPTSLDKSKMASKKQVEIAPKVAKAFKEQNSNFYFPTHEGYTDLVATKEEEENYQEVIDICLKIIEEGWNGDWKVRMERCRNKLNS